MSDKRKWVPEIMYEEYEEDSLSGGLPFIQVPFLANQTFPVSTSRAIPIMSPADGLVW